MVTKFHSRREFLTTVTGFAGSIMYTSTAESAVPLAPPEKQPSDLKIEEAPAKKLGWAIVGLGELALEEIMPAFRDCRLSTPTALVSGHPEKARKIAKAYNIQEDAIYNYENYDKIADDPRIDVVYIVLPNSMHAEFTIRALKAGKHVLCEKPMSVTVEEAISMKKAADEAGKKLSIAYRLHYEPMNLQVMKWRKEQKFGKIKTFNSSNCQNVKAPNIRLSKGLGGGPVGDVGVYSINAARYAINEEPIEVSAFAHQPKDDPRFAEVPESVSFILRYPSGVIANCDCSFGTSNSKRYRVHCAKGYIEMDPAFSYQGLKLVTSSEGESGPEKTDATTEEINHFTAEMDAFSKAILENGEFPTTADMGIADMRIIEAIGKSIDTGAPVRIEA